MLRTYKFYLSRHIMLHQHVLNFFNRIEFETGEFSDDFFDDDFLKIVNRHPTILRKRSFNIFDKLRRLEQDERTRICNEIRLSNDIEAMCVGTHTPKKIDKKTTGLWKDLRDFFLDLYLQVLDGSGFRDEYSTTLREHFNVFSNLNKSITKCPICGIGELKKAEDECRDQYDHFFPKGFYPFSSVNFVNLVPSCKECNSFDAKGETDIVAVSSGKIFFPYNNNHAPIILAFKIIKDDIKIESIEWEMNFTNSKGENDEITSWRSIYSIDSRYEGFVKARIEKWYRHYWKTVSSTIYNRIPEDERDETYFEFLRNDEEIELDFIRLPSLTGFLRDSTMATAELQASFYS